MSRINVDTTPDGWFDPDTSTLYEEDLRWVDFTDEDELDDSEDAEDGYYVSAATGTDYSHEWLYHTADGRWVLKEWTDEKRAGTYKFISDSAAASWIDINEPPKAPSPRRGRPEVGNPVHLRLSPELKTQLDQFASTNNLTRAEAVRRLLTVGLADLAR